MKRVFFLALALLIPLLSQAEDIVRTDYGAVRAFNFCLQDEADTNRFINSVDFTAGDCASSACCQVSLDGGVLDDCDNQPTALAGGCYNFTASAAELTSEFTKYFIVDAAVAERFADKSLTFITFNDASSWFGIPEVNMVQINGDATSGNNATLSLAQLNINNSGGSAIVATSSGGGGHGMFLMGGTGGNGLRAQGGTGGGATGAGGYFAGGGSGGYGLYAFGGGTNGAGLVGDGQGTGADIGVGATGNDIFPLIKAEADQALVDYDPPTETEMSNRFDDVEGATFNTLTDSLAAIRDQGDVAWITATGFAVPNEYSATLATIEGKIDALPDTAAINAEMVDVMAVDTHAELAACPVVPATYETMLLFSYGLARNRITESGGTQTIYKDDGTTALCEFSTTDDGVTFTRGEGTAP